HPCSESECLDPFCEPHGELRGELTGTGGKLQGSAVHRQPDHATARSLPGAAADRDHVGRRRVPHLDVQLLDGAEVDAALPPEGARPGELPPQESDRFFVVGADRRAPGAGAQDMSAPDCAISPPPEVHRRGDSLPRPAPPRSAGAPRPPPEWSAPPPRDDPDPPDRCWRGGGRRDDTPGPAPSAGDTGRPRGARAPRGPGGVRPLRKSSP